MIIITNKLKLTNKKSSLIIIDERERKLYYYLSKFDMKKEELEINEEDDEFVKKLKEKLKMLNRNKKFVTFLSREKDIEYQMNTERSEGIDEGINIGFSKGITIGKSEGKNESKIEIAKNMLNEKVDLNIICKTTGLTEQEILNLQKVL